MKEVPTVEQAIAYFIEKGSTEREGRKFWLYYDSRNWIIGKVPMQKWKSAAAGWLLRNEERQPAPVLRPQVDYMRHLRA